MKELKLPIAIFLVGYFVGAFISASFNISHWNPFIRGFIGFGGLTTYIIFYVFSVIDKISEDE